MVPTFELGSREPGSGGLYVGAVHAACHMARSEELSRLSIVQAMTDALEPLSFIQAFYEGGAAAFHRIDVWSDIDLYIVVDDAMVPKTFRVVEKVLASLSPIRLIHEEPWPAASGIFQKFYRLEKAGKFLLVDLAVLTVSAPDKFLVRERSTARSSSCSTRATRSKSPHSIARHSFAACSIIAGVFAN